MVMSPQAASGLDGVSASRHKNEAQTQRWLHRPCLLMPSQGPKIGWNGYITHAFSGSAWWGEVNMATAPLLSWGPHGGEKST